MGFNRGKAPTAADVAVGLTDYLAPTIRDLSHYLEFLRDEGLAPPSVARHLVALKMFYRFLRLEERTRSNAVDLLSSPALWERIPQVLSPEAVERLLRAPRPGDRFCLRDRALLETLYATGCRASAGLFSSAPGSSSRRSAGTSGWAGHSRSPWASGQARSW